jgi:serine/threonine protein kinase
VASFLREACTSAQLRHANIVQVLDFGVADTSHYLALELVDGLDLRALLRRRAGSDPFEPEMVVLIAGDLLQALDHAHGGSQQREVIVHRDLSPSNVLASRAGEIKLTDFGIARALGQTQHTATGIIKGKVPYLPPEYIERGEFTARSDLFSLGVLLHELLTGKRPFDGESDLDTVRRILAGQRPPLRELAPHAPDTLSSVIDALLARDPAERPASARAVLELLPDVPVHRLRARLGELVRAGLGEIATGEAALTRRALQKDELETRKQEPSAPDSRAPTRTIERPPVRGATRALLAASSLLLAVVAAAGLRTWLRSEAPPRAQAEAPKAQTPKAQARAPQTSSTPLSVEPAPQPAAAPPVQAPADKPSPDAPGELRVVVVPFGDVWVDGRPRGHAPVLVRLPPGNHEVAWGDGRPDGHRNVRLAPGAHEKVVLRRNVE